MMQTTRDFKQVVATKGTICYTRITLWNLGCKNCERYETTLCPKVNDLEDEIPPEYPVTAESMITYRGEAKTLREWCDELGFYVSLAIRRINEGNRSIKRAFARVPDKQTKESE